MTARSWRVDGARMGGNGTHQLAIRRKGFSPSAGGSRTGRTSQPNAKRLIPMPRRKRRPKRLACWLMDATAPAAVRKHRPKPRMHFSQLENRGPASRARIGGDSAAIAPRFPRLNCRPVRSGERDCGHAQNLGGLGSVWMAFEPPPPAFGSARRDPLNFVPGPYFRAVVQWMPRLSAWSLPLSTRPRTSPTR
jgi:hypothetical protein